MEQIEVIREHKQLGGFKTIRKRSYIETYNNLNQLIHYIDLTYVKAGIFFHGWVGFRSNDQMKEILQGHFLEIFTESNCDKILMDCSKMKGSFIDINTWYAEAFMPNLVNLGLKHHAIVKPNDNFAQLAFRDWSNKINGFKNNSFATLGEAINWLSLL